MCQKRIVFIVNPISGVVGKDKVVAAIRKYIDSDLYTYTIRFTRHAGHAVEICTEEVERGVDMIAIAGGDGSINEVLPVLVDTDIPLAILPAGSGNGLSYHLGIRRSLKVALDSINTGHTIKVDVGTINNDYFVNIAGTGYEASVAYALKGKKKRGYKAYVWGAVQTLQQYTKLSQKVEIDGVDYSGEYAFIIAANGRYFGYDFNIAPYAELSDGLLDFILIKHTFPLKYVLLYLFYRPEEMMESSLVTYIQGKSLRVYQEDDAHYHYDGEGHIVTEPLDISISSRKLDLVVPA